MFEQLKSAIFNTALKKLYYNVNIMPLQIEFYVLKYNYNVM